MPAAAAVPRGLRGARLLFLKWLKKLQIQENAALCHNELVMTEGDFVSLLKLLFLLLSYYKPVCA